MRHAARIHSNSTNPAITALADSWHNYIPSYQGEGVYTRLQPIQSDLNTMLKKNTLSSSFPWQACMPSTDCNLSEFVDKQTQDKQHIKQTALKYLDKYKTHLCIYTDGSKDGAKTACSVYRQDHIEQYRLPDNTEVTDAELFAINAAIRNAICQDSYKDIAICTDSLSNIRAITNNRHNKLDQRFLPLQAAYIEANSKSINIVIVWVPAHVGIAGNEEADRLAKQALLLPDNEISTIPTTITDCYKN
jgi:kelch-like protein 2/3